MRDGRFYFDNVGVQFPPRCEPRTRIHHWRCSLLCSSRNLGNHKPVDSDQSCASAAARKRKSGKKKGTDGEADRPSYARERGPNQERFSAGMSASQKKTELTKPRLPLFQGILPLDRSRV